MIRKLLPGLLKPIFWVNLWKNTKLVWRVALDKRTPLYLKLIPLLVGAYILFPIDLMPEFIPIIGQLDDLALLMLGTQLFLRFAPTDVISQYQKN